MTITPLSDSDQTHQERFNNYVINHPRGNFLQSWNWGQWQQQQDLQVLRYFFMDKDQLLGCAQAVYKQTPLGNYFYCAYGPLWNESLPEVEIKELLQLLKVELRKQNKTLFVRIEPTVQTKLTALGAVRAESIQPPQTLIKNIDVDQEQLINTFHSKTRYNIRVAEKHGVEVAAHQEPKQEVLDLIMSTAKRQNYRNYSREYIENLWAFFADNANLSMTGYLAKKGDLPLASGLMVDFGRTRMYLFGGSNYEHRALMAPYILHWQAMLDAKQKGLAQYDFGAAEDASGHQGSYTRFKMGFNPEVWNFSGTHDLVIDRHKYKLYRLARSLNRLVKHLRIKK